MAHHTTPRTVDAVVIGAGFGGIYAEILNDSAIALGPVDAEAAAAMIRSLRGAPLLSGARGRPGSTPPGAAGRAGRTGRCCPRSA